MHVAAKSLGTLALALLAVAGVSHAAGTSRQINVTTYLREGPGIAYRVIDEAETGQPVDVVSCAKGWCRIAYGGAFGYVAQNTIKDRSGVSAQAGKAHCIVNKEAGYHGSDADVLCNTAPPTKP